MPNTFYIITAGTYNKEHLFRGDQRLNLLQSSLFDALEACQWQPQAWAIFSNHYHIVAQSPDNAQTLSAMINRIHSQTARKLNKLDGTPRRKVWFQFWDHCLTFEKSYYARLNYVNNNPVKHHQAAKPELYPGVPQRGSSKRQPPPIDAK
jgi:putative transposase